MTCDSELNTSPCVQCLTDKVKCYKKLCGPGCYRCYTKKGACSLVQGRRVKEDDDADPVANRCIEELLEGLGEKMDELTRVLKIGFGRLGDSLEQGVEDNHNYREGERIRRKKELMKKVLEKLVGRSEEPKEPAGLVVENQIGEIGEEMVVEGQ